MAFEFDLYGPIYMTRELNYSRLIASFTKSIELVTNLRFKYKSKR